jgi:hypothetical protein
MIFSMGTALQSVRNTKNWHSGYMIVLPIDLRFYDAYPDLVWFQAHCIDHNVVQLTIPAFDFDIVQRPDDIAREVDAYENEAFENGLNDFGRHFKDRKTHKIRLVFPRDHRLSSSEVFDKAGEEERLDYTILKLKTEHQAEDQDSGRKIQLQTLKLYMLFKIARLDIPACKRGKFQEGNSGSEIDEIRQKLNGMNVRP